MKRPFDLFSALLPAGAGLFLATILVLIIVIPTPNLPRLRAYPAFVKNAEEATAAIGDPDLRRLAFDRILRDMLRRGQPNFKRETQ
jgi:hypothetical protein